MEKIVYSQDSVQSIALLESMMNIHVKDLVVEENKLFVILEKQEFDKLRERTGFNLKHLEQMFKKHIRVVQFDEDPRKFITNLVFPIRIKMVNEESGVFSLEMEEKTYKGLLIGKNGGNLNLIKRIVNRFFDFKNIVVV